MGLSYSKPSADIVHKIDTKGRVFFCQRGLPACLSGVCLVSTYDTKQVSVRRCLLCHCQLLLLHLMVVRLCFRRQQAGAVSKQAAVVGRTQMGNAQAAVMKRRRERSRSFCHRMPAQ